MNYAESMNEIIITASILFSMHGYEEVSINEICRKQKISKGMFYYYFKDKEDLLIACCEHAYSIIDRVFEIYEFNPDYNITEHFINLFKCYQKIASKYNYTSYLVFMVNASPPSALKDCRKRIVYNHNRMFLNLAEKVLKACNLKMGPMQIGLSFHTAFIMTYAMNKSLESEEMSVFIGNKILESFSYYFRQCLFGSIPRNVATITNPKLSTDINDKSLLKL